MDGLLSISMLDVAEKKPITSLKPTEKTGWPDEPEPWEEESTTTHTPNRPEDLEPEGTGSSGEFVIMWRQMPPATPGFSGSLADESDPPPSRCRLTG